MEESKHVSRRDFLKMAGLAGASVGLGLGLGGLVAACGGATTTTAAAATTQSSAATTQTTAATTPGSSASTTTSVASGPATGTPIKIGFIEGFTGFMALDAANCDKGILTALAMIDNQVAGRPIQYVKADDQSDPVAAVDKAKQLVQSDKIDFMIGPLYSPAAQAVTDYLAKSSGIPQCSLAGQPSDNLTTANKLAFMPTGLYGSQGYYFGKYASQVLGYKMANCINNEDTAARGLQAGFEKGFAEGGGKIVSVNYVPMDTIDFSSYLTTLKPADCTYFWIIGNGANPFVQQYHSYGLKAPLIVPMANNFVEAQLKDLGTAMGLNIVGCDYYTPTLSNALNTAFTAAYQKLYPGEYPTPDGYAAWQAVNLFVDAVKQTNGDTTPAKVIQVMSTESIDTPAGKVTMSPYKNAYIGTRDWLIEKTEDVGNGRIAWVTIYTYPQVLMGE